MNNIPGYENFLKIELVDKGWSSDKKYYIETKDGSRLLLRISSRESYDNKKIEFEMMQKVEKMGIPMSKPLQFGLCDDGVYALFTWCDGEDAEKRLPQLSEAEQYMLGVKSGEYLRQIHSIPAPEKKEPWNIRFNRKIDRNMKNYEACEIHFDGDKKMIEYLEANRYLLDERPQCFQHGDYHVGNMILDSDNILSVIDFNRKDFGDPWEEFNRISFSVVASPHFATGQLNGYFGGTPPMKFFQLLAFYMASNTLSAIPWAIPFGEKEIQTMLKQAADVLAWFSDMQNPVPTWYLKDFYVQKMDGIPYKLKEPFDFSFLKKYGKVFTIFDDQDSGNICFGVQQEKEKYFIKFAGAPTSRKTIGKKEAIANLKVTETIYKDLAHPSLIKLIDTEEMQDGYAMRFQWEDGDCFGRMYPESHARFQRLPIEHKLGVFSDILSFHAFAAEKGYVAIDFYDGSLMYYAEKKKTIICDIDLYAKKPYINQMGRLWGSARYMSPEEFQLGAAIDEVSNVYAMGAMAFSLFGGTWRDDTKSWSKDISEWRLNEKMFSVVLKAVSPERKKRQQSINELIRQWHQASLR